MTTAAMVIMCASVGTILCLLTFCLFRVMTAPLPEDD